MKNLLYIFTLLVVAGSVSCKKEQPEMKPMLEDCSCANEVSADFLMEEVYGYSTPYAKYTNSDSIFADKIVIFKAKEENAEYTWYLGQETEFGVSFVERNFPASFIGQTLPITLVVKKKPNYLCFPNDDGYDSITKYITVAMDWEDYYNRTDVPLAGNFRVKSSTMADSIDINTIHYLSPSGVIEYFVIRDIPNWNNTDSLWKGGVPQNYRQFWGHMSQYFVDFHHRIDGKVIIKMENLISGQPSQYFEGRKL